MARAEQSLSGQTVHQSRSADMYVDYGKRRDQQEKREQFVAQTKRFRSRATNSGAYANWRTRRPPSWRKGAPCVHAGRFG